MCVWGLCARMSHVLLCMTGRYKHVHGLKYQLVGTPDGMMCCLCGPFSCATHDQKVLTRAVISLLPHLVVFPFHHHLSDPTTLCCRQALELSGLKRILLEHFALPAELIDALGALYFMLYGDPGT